MPEIAEPVVAGVDVGTECVKAVILGADRTVLARTVVPASGYYQDRAQEALGEAAEDAQIQTSSLARICLTGFGARSTPFASTMTVSETGCHARAAFHHFHERMTVVDVGGRDPKVIVVDGRGWPAEVRTIRKCAVGIGTFLMFAARHLGVHPTRLMELAAAADRPATISSYCSVFAESEVLERLRDGEARERIALGCMHAIAERLLEIGNLSEPLVVTGGVAEYFPGVVAAVESRSGVAIRIVPNPIMSGALGAALKALEAEG